MRALAAFAAAASLVVGTISLLNWWVDPLGGFYDRGVLAAADKSNCLISDDLVGTGSWLPFKEDVLRQRGSDTVLLGTSRVLKVAARPGERAFANLGMPGTGIETLAPFFRRLHRLHPEPLTVYLGVELFWLNPNWHPNITFASGLRQDLRYALARQTLSASASVVAESPGMLTDRWARGRAGGRCAIDRAGRLADGKRDGWETDGSFTYRFELLGTASRFDDDEYERDLVRFEGPYYREWRGLDPERLTELRGALALAQSFGWHVVGYTPPYSRRYSTRLQRAFPGLWRGFGAAMQETFERAGSRWLDLRQAADVPCADDAFMDDGWHPNAACSRSVRARLDAAA